MAPRTAVPTMVSTKGRYLGSLVSEFALTELVALTLWLPVSTPFDAADDEAIDEAEEDQEPIEVFEFVTEPPLIASYKSLSSQSIAICMLVLLLLAIFVEHNGSTTGTTLATATLSQVDATMGHFMVGATAYDRLDR